MEAEADPGGWEVEKADFFPGNTGSMWQSTQLGRAAGPYGIREGQQAPLPTVGYALCCHGCQEG